MFGKLRVLDNESFIFVLSIIGILWVKGVFDKIVNYGLG